MNDSISPPVDQAEVPAAQLPGPRGTLPDFRRGRRIVRVLVLMVIGSIALYYWRKAHTLFIYSQIQQGKGRIERRLTGYQQFLDTLVGYITGVKVGNDPYRGVIWSVVLMDPTEEELRVLGRESTIEILFINGKTLTPGVMKLISRQTRLRRLWMHFPGIDDQELLRIVQSLHGKTVLGDLAILTETTVTDAGVNAVANLHKIDGSLHLEGSKVTGSTLEIPNRKSTHSSKLRLILGHAAVTDKTLDQLLAATKIDFLGVETPGVSFGKLLATKEVGQIHRLIVTRMNLIEEELVKLSREYPKTYIHSGRETYLGGNKDAK